MKLPRDASYMIREREAKEDAELHTNERKDDKHGDGALRCAHLGPRHAQLLYPVVVMESADWASDHNVWNHSVSGLSILWYVWDPKKSL